MGLNPATANVTEVRVYCDRAVTVRSGASILWATVEIYYSLQGMTPDITIRLPVECKHVVGSDACRTKVLQSARALLKHIYSSVAMTSDGAMAGNGLVTDQIGKRERSRLEGQSQEWGLATPTTKPPHQLQHQKGNERCKRVA
jgi:hypothetical protein